MLGLSGPGRTRADGLGVGKQLCAAHSHATERVLALPYIP